MINMAAAVVKELEGDNSSEAAQSPCFKSLQRQLLEAGSQDKVVQDRRLLRVVENRLHRHRQDHRQCGPAGELPGVSVGSVKPSPGASVSTALGRCARGAHLLMT